MEEKIKGIIYRHWLINDKGILCRYTGQTSKKTVEDRIKLGYRSSSLFNNYINKYGWDNINTMIIKEGYYTQEQLDNYEIFYIKDDKENSDIKCLNIADGGNGGNLGEEAIAKQSETIKRKIASGEITFDHLKGDNNWMRKPENRSKVEKIYCGKNSSNKRSEVRTKRSKTMNERIASGEITFENQSKYMKENNPMKRPIVVEKIKGDKNPQYNHEIDKYKPIIKLIKRESEFTKEWNTNNSSDIVRFLKDNFNVEFSRKIINKRIKKWGL
jgi:hypothetical protein